MPQMRNSVRPLLLALAAASCLTPRAAQAVVVLKKGVETPLMGHLVRADQRSIVIRQELPGGKTRDVTIARGDIEELIETVSQQRLSELDPARPAAYLEYAEELAEKRRDPQARDAARRLLTIAAHRGDRALRNSSLLILANLARTEDQRRSIQALIYLNDPRHDDSILTTSAALAATADPSARTDLLTALRLIRQGQGSAAKALLDKKTVQSEIASLSEQITLHQLTTLAAERTLTDNQLALILRAELALEPQPANSSPSAPQSWSKAAATHGLAPVPPLDLTHLTEFDPTECLYRNGKWQRP
jgi:hypothetical protein